MNLVTERISVGNRSYNSVHTNVLHYHYNRWVRLQVLVSEMTY